jgi:hypothetical protein
MEEGKRVKLRCPYCDDPENPVDHLLIRNEKIEFDDSRTKERTKEYEWEITGYCLPCCENFFASNVSDEHLERIHNGTMTQREFDSLFKAY